MVGASSSCQNMKFLCSYGGRILPRYPDGKLRYHGGETRVLSVGRSISFADLLVKLAEMCGSVVSLRCQLPTEDLDALVSITSDEDLANLIEEYDRAVALAAQPPSSLKIRAFLSAPKTTQKSSSPPSSASSASNRSTSPKSPLCASSSSVHGGVAPRCPIASIGGRCIRNASRPPLYPIISEKTAGKLGNNWSWRAYSCGSAVGETFTAWKIRRRSKVKMDEMFFEELKQLLAVPFGHVKSYVAKAIGENYWRWR